MEYNGLNRMNPLDIFRRTPRSNCGNCGHPTCLAFAAAVAKTGEDPRRCPEIDMTGLVIPKTAPGERPDPAREHDLALIEHLKSKVALLDFSAIATTLGASWSQGRPDSLFFSYLNREAEVSKEGVLIQRRPPVDPRDQILLYNYVHAGGGRVPDHTWIGLESLPNTISKVKTLATYGEEPLARLFTGRLPMMAAMMQQAGGVPVADVPATAGFIVPVLPMVPLFVPFWDEEPEEGFSARVKILFDRYVLDFLDLESLVFSAERLAERVIELAGNPD
jgi:hypothetical protein